MAITESFIESFEKFVKDYEYHGAGYIKNGIRYEPICILLKALHLTIKHNKEHFTDRAVIGYIATTAIAMLDDAPALAKTLHKFMSAWQDKTDRLSPFFNFSIDLDPLEPLDLLSQLQIAFELTKSSYEAQLAVMKKQLDTERQDNAQLKERCEHLAQQELLSRTRVNLDLLEQARRLMSELNGVMNRIEHTEPACSSSSKPVLEMPPQPVELLQPQPAAAADAPSQSMPPLAPPVPEFRQQPASSSSQSSRLFKAVPTVTSFSTELLERIKKPNLRKTVATADDEDQLKKNTMT